MTNKKELEAIEGVPLEPKAHKISWTEKTWNPMTGCTRVSTGCKNCYMMPLANRLLLMGNPKYVNGHVPTFHEFELETPSTWRKPQLVFTGSMTDIFHEDFTDSQIAKVFAVMNLITRHTFQVLTKRPERMIQLERDGVIFFTPNIWAGVTVESNDPKVIARADILRDTEAFVKWLSIEPLVEYPKDLNYEGIDWVVVGGESGKELEKLRKMSLQWPRDIFLKCKELGIAYFYKQGGRLNKCEGHTESTGFSKRCKGAKGCKLLDGQKLEEYPERVIFDMSEAETKEFKASARIHKNLNDRINSLVDIKKVSDRSDFIVSACEAYADYLEGIETREELTVRLLLEVADWIEKGGDIKDILSTSQSLAEAINRS